MSIPIISAPSALDRVRFLLLSPFHTRHKLTTIDVRVLRVSQLFNSLDPSPFYLKDLDHDAEDYILTYAQESPDTTDFLIRVFLGPGTAPPSQAESDDDDDPQTQTQTKSSRENDNNVKSPKGQLNAKNDSITRTNNTRTIDTQLSSQGLVPQKPTDVPTTLPQETTPPTVLHNPPPQFVPETSLPTPLPPTTNTSTPNQRRTPEAERPALLPEHAAPPNPSPSPPPPTTSPESPHFDPDAYTYGDADPAIDPDNDDDDAYAADAELVVWGATRLANVRASASLPGGVGAGAGTGTNGTQSQSVNPGPSRDQVDQQTSKADATGAGAQGKRDSGGHRTRSSSLTKISNHGHTYTRHRSGSAGLGPIVSSGGAATTGSIGHRTHFSSSTRETPSTRSLRGRKLQRLSTSTPNSVGDLRADPEAVEFLEKDVQAAITRHFDYQARRKHISLRTSLASLRISLLVGVVILGSALALSRVLDSLAISPDASPFSQTLAAVASQSLLVLGWVSVWRPAELIIYGWVAIYREWKFLCVLAKARVELKFSGNISLPRRRSKWGD
ncbi:hypothetical protein M427DRAFT_40460 [Gonapodya prolifera JEL478]|uniref:Uncharacterized protein n=1 Tax=Gonapodya prolifera (strain JEL478) TaxID=1344416 RepID=A0A139AXV7_GONPJ|nr:hypothetical protein M427DRAFT_40460 [Gonapodya prolifera JEL478]|eukprot:KXS21537.1 hypothetical protein M427DRAFT_40460 [Gonapodya prolifera JEL478]